MRRTSSILYISLDGLLDSRGVLPSGFDEFTAELDHAGVAAVWLSTQTRMQLDEPRRRLGHRHPFMAEDGCGVFLPQDYFHLRPQGTRTGGSKAGGNTATVRLGRFLCLPIAEPQPAATDALESMAADSGTAIVPVRSLAPRELAQNLGLPQREADLARQRDFDELFFFAGAATDEVKRFHGLAHAKGCQLRERGAFWSLAIGASVPRCVRELSKLYDRALHGHVRSIALGVRGSDETLASACDRAVLLTETEGASHEDAKRGGRVMELPICARSQWGQILEAIIGKD